MLPSETSQLNRNLQRQISNRNLFSILSVLFLYLSGVYSMKQQMNPSEKCQPPRTVDSAPNKKLEISCSLCSTTFPSRNQLFRHLRQNHEDLFDGDEFNGSGGNFESGAQRTAASIQARSKLSNEHHEAYYKIQAAPLTTTTTKTAGPLPSFIFNHEEFETALEYFRLPLPVAFRLTRSSTSETSLMRSRLERYLSKEHKNLDGNDVNTSAALKSSPFMDPDISRVAIIPPREWSKQAQQVLMDAQDLGCLNRQELCSMLPPMLLLHPNLNNSDVETNEKSTKHSKVKSPTTVLDMCAAPGSKSLQLMDEITFRQCEDATAPTPSSQKASMSLLLSQVLSKSMLVFNDPNRHRLITVSRRTRRHLASCGVVMSCSDGRFFPALRKFAGYKLKFDAVLCDVPCSGDGTLRKLGVQGWKDWGCKLHLQLHKLQVKLLVRALQLVRKGGRVVYSTCSLDPIEDEAVVAAALSRVPGGPTSYRVVAPPRYLGSNAQQPFPYKRGATSWVVPHPKFRADSPQTYQNFNDVPKNLQSKDIVASMFPPRTKLEEDMIPAFRRDDDWDHPEASKPRSSNAEDDEINKKKIDPIEQARFFGDILSESDISALEEMLPNCCRILPQHLDSGGFFCAVIERINPVYYAVCCPQERSNGSFKIASEVAKDAIASSGDSWHKKYHGSIFCNVTSAKQLRTVISDNKKTFGEEVYFEGLATLELAHKWLHQHGAYVPGVSDQDPISLCEEFVAIGEDASINDSKEINQHEITQHLEKPEVQCEEVSTPQKRNVDNDVDSSNVNRNSKSQGKKRKANGSPATYKPMFQPPHPALVSEFCEFFGMYQGADEADIAGVTRFPSEHLVITGGPAVRGEEGVISQIETCLDPDVAHTEIVSAEEGDGDDVPDSLKKIPRRRRFFQLGLASDEIRSLYSGGAKFAPAEVGLTLCSIPIPGPWRRPKIKSNNKKPEGNASSSRRPEKSGRYGLNDKAAELVGYCATRRVVAATHDECQRLLKSRALIIESAIGERSESQSLQLQERDQDQLSIWWQKWGKSRIHDISTWESGAVIVACAVIDDYHESRDKESSAESAPVLPHTIFLSCLLRDEDGTSNKRLELLTEQRISDCLTRLL